MKKMYYISITYLIIGLFMGLFNHEVAYYTNFTGTTTLSYFHAHAIILGSALFFIIPIFMKVFSVNKHKNFKKFMIFYNLGLSMSLFFMAARGIYQLFMLQIPSFIDHMIGGLAGIGHILLTIGLCFLFNVIISAVSKDYNKTENTDKEYSIS